MKKLHRKNNVAANQDRIRDKEKYERTEEMKRKVDGGKPYLFFNVGTLFKISDLKHYTTADELT